MSPEQVRGQLADHRSDIFSLGAVLYEMLTGTRAFRGDTPVETMNAILKDDPPEPSRSVADLPPSLDRIVLHCLEKSPEERFQSARDVAFDLETLSTAPSGAAAAIDHRKPRIARRFRAAATGLALLSIAVAESTALPLPEADVLFENGPRRASSERNPSECARSRKPPDDSRRLGELSPLLAGWWANRVLRPSAIRRRSRRGCGDRPGGREEDRSLGGMVERAGTRLDSLG
jgi:serine/threonine protein kinase